MSAASRSSLARVRRQNIWRRSRRKLAECGPRLGLGFRRRACGVASVDVRLSVEPPRVDDRRVISGIIRMLKCGGRWADVPSEYGPPTTVYNRWNRSSRRGIWTRILAALTEEGWIAETAQIDSSYINVHRCAGGAKKGGRKNAIGISRGGRTTKAHALVDVIGRPLRLVLTPGNTSDFRGADLLLADAVKMKRMIADRGYDANKLRATLKANDTIPVIPGRRNRKRPIQYDERRYKDRLRVEAMFCRLKDFRRVATRYDKLARNFLSAVHLAAAIAFWP